MASLFSFLALAVYGVKGQISIILAQGHVDTDTECGRVFQDFFYGSRFYKDGCTADALISFLSHY